MRKRLAIIAGVLILALLIGGAVLLATTGLPGIGQAPGSRPAPGTGSVAGPGPSPTPGAPTKLVAQPGDTTIQLAWPPVAGAGGYLVYRDGAPDPLDPSPTTATNYLDLGLTNSRTYTYTIAPLDQSRKPLARLGPVAAAPRSK